MLAMVTPLTAGILFYAESPQVGVRALPNAAHHHQSPAGARPGSRLPGQAGPADAGQALLCCQGLARSAPGLAPLVHMTPEEAAPFAEAFFRRGGAGPATAPGLVAAGAAEAWLAAGPFCT